MATVSVESDKDGKPGFSMKETTVLLVGICEHREALSEPETTAATSLKKFIIYKAIADRVNRATLCLPSRGGGVERSADDVRQKWLQLKEEAVSTRRRKFNLKDNPFSSDEEEEKEDAVRGSYMDLVHDVMAGRVSPMEVAERVSFVFNGWLNDPAGLKEGPSVSTGQVEPRVPWHAPGPRVKQEDGVDGEQPYLFGERGKPADTDNGQDCERTTLRHVKTELKVDGVASDLSSSPGTQESKRDERQSDSDEGVSVSVNNHDYSLVKKKKRDRKQNYNEGELSVLLSGIMMYRDVIVNPSKCREDCQRKMQCWGKILHQLNQSGASNVQRNVSEIRHKWKQLRKDVLDSKRPINSSEAHLLAYRVREILSGMATDDLDTDDSEKRQKRDHDSSTLAVSDCAVPTSSNTLGRDEPEIRIDACVSNGDVCWDVISLGNQEQKKKRDRKQNFNEEEVFVLLSGIMKYRSVILKPCRNKEERKRKADCWEKVLSQLHQSGASKERRTVQEILHKWKDLRHGTKRPSNSSMAPLFAHQVREILGSTETDDFDTDSERSWQKGSSGGSTSTQNGCAGPIALPGSQSDSSCDPTASNIECRGESEIVSASQKVDICVDEAFMANQNNKRQRKQNFNKKEIHVMLSGIMKYRDALMKPGQNTKNVERKAHCWRKIIHQINQSGASNVRRTIDEIRIKWKHMRMDVLGSNHLKYSRIAPEFAHMVREILNVKATDNCDTDTDVSDDNASLQEGRSGVNSVDQTTCSSNGECNESEMLSDGIVSGGDVGVGHASSVNQKKKRERKQNFSEEEISVLLSAVMKYRDVILKQGKGTSDIRRKTRCWGKILDHLNQSGASDVLRTADELKVKWRHLKQDVLEPNSAVYNSAASLFAQRVREIVGTMATDDLDSTGRQGGDQDGNTSAVNDRAGPTPVLRYQSDLRGDQTASSRNRNSGNTLDRDKTGMVSDGCVSDDSCWDTASLGKPKKKRVRKKNFNENEVSVMLSGIAKYRGVIMKATQNKRDRQRKAQGWLRVVHLLNQSGSSKVRRTVPEIKVKWKQMRKDVTESKLPINISVAPLFAERVREILSGPATDDLGSDDCLEGLDYDPGMVSGVNQNDDDSVDVASSTEQRKKRDRKQNFTEEEISSLLSGIMMYRDVILKPGQSRKAMQRKTECWENILHQINQSGTSSVQRTAYEIKHKWKQMRLDVLGSRRPINSSVAPIFANMVWEIIGGNVMATGDLDTGCESWQKGVPGGSTSTPNTSAGPPNLPGLQSDSSCDQTASFSNTSEQCSTNGNLHVKMEFTPLGTPVSSHYHPQVAKFSPAEVSLLLQQVRQHHRILNSKLRTLNIIRHKQRCWQMITAKINYMLCKTGSKGRAPKTWQEVRSKFLALQAEGVTDAGVEASLSGGGSQGRLVSLLGDKVSGDGKLIGEDMRTKATAMNIQATSRAETAEKQPALTQFKDKLTLVQGTGKVALMAQSLLKQTATHRPMEIETATHQTVERQTATHEAVERQTATHQAVERRTLKENQTEGKPMIGTSGYKEKMEDLSPEVKHHLDTLLYSSQRLQRLGLEVGVVVKSANAVQSCGSWGVVQEQLAGHDLGAGSQGCEQGWQVTPLVSHGNDGAKGHAAPPTPHHKLPTTSTVVGDNVDLGCLGDSLATRVQNTHGLNANDIVCLDDDLMEALVHPFIKDSEDREPDMGSNPGRQHKEGVPSTFTDAPPNSSDKVWHQCQHCDRFYRNPSNLENHIDRVHRFKNRFEVEQAARDRRILQKARLYAAKRQHRKFLLQQGRRYMCEDCGKAFTLESNLMQHMRIHREEKGVFCPHCPASFYRKSTLTLHLRQHTGERPYLCEVCGKSFVRGPQLKQHMRWHSGEQPFVCQDCGKAFRSKHDLNVHCRTHTGIQPYLCDFCAKPFPTAYKLKVHRRQHTGEKPYTCNICGDKFTRLYNLSDHKRRLHSSVLQTVKAASTAIPVL